MKKTFLLDLAFLTLLFGTLGCDFAKGGHKPLIGGIRQTVEACAVNDRNHCQKEHQVQGPRRR